MKVKNVALLDIHLYRYAELLINNTQVCNSLHVASTSSHSVSSLRQLSKLSALGCTRLGFWLPEHC